MKTFVVLLIALLPADTPSGGSVEVIETFRAPSLGQAMYACHAYRRLAWRAWGTDDVLMMVCKEKQDENRPE